MTAELTSKERALLSPEIWDCLIIGAGAAGLMAAIQCAKSGLQTILLDSQKRIGAKILMSGGTRCNVTNDIVRESDYQTNYSKKGVHHVLASYPSPKLIDFFQSNGVDLRLELGGKYFPTTNSAHTVLDSLTQALHQSGAVLKTEQKVRRIVFEENLFHVMTEGFGFRSRNIMVCTGGLSYPGTGSDGTGYELAKAFGHSIIPTIPALSPLLTNDTDFQSLSGIALPVSLTLLIQKQKGVQYADDFLFTHFGFSGPAALDMSRHWIRAHEKHSSEIQLEADFLPRLKESKLREEISASRETKGLTLKNFLIRYLPERLCAVLLKQCNIPVDQNLNHLRKELLESLLKAIYHSPLPISGAFGYKKAEVTAGGISLEEITLKTMESKLQPGLFFAGEILDVDGRIGGFNFQWAWSSAVVAAEGVLQKLRPRALKK